MTGRTRAFLDGFAFITISGLFVFEVLPQAIAAGGLTTWIFAVLGKPA